MLRSTLITCVGLLGLLVSPFVSGNSYEAVVTLKNTTALQVTVVDIVEWGLETRTEGGIHFRVMVEIATPDSGLVERIQTLYPDVTVSRSSDRFVIRPPVYDPPARVHGSGRAFDQFYVMLNLMSTPREHVELQFAQVSAFSDRIMTHVSVSSGFEINSTTSVLAFGLGIGPLVTFDDDRLTCSVLLHIASKHTPIHIEGKEIVYSSANFYQIIPERAIWTGGIRYYFSNLAVDDRTPRFGVHLGVGIRF